LRFLSLLGPEGSNGPAAATSFKPEPTMDLLSFDCDTPGQHPQMHVFYSHWYYVALNNELLVLSRFDSRQCDGLCVVRAKSTTQLWPRYFLLSVHEDITGYRDDSLQIVKRN
jgi:hypothetical protein